MGIINLRRSCERLATAKLTAAKDLQGSGLLHVGPLFFGIGQNLWSPRIVALLTGSFFLGNVWRKGLFSRAHWEFTADELLAERIVR